VVLIALCLFIPRGLAASSTTVCANEAVTGFFNHQINFLLDHEIVFHLDTGLMVGLNLLQPLG